MLSIEIYWVITLIENIIMENLQVRTYFLNPHVACIRLTHVSKQLEGYGVLLVNLYFEQKKSKDFI